MRLGRKVGGSYTGGWGRASLKHALAVEGYLKVGGIQSLVDDRCRSPGCKRLSVLVTRSFEAMEELDCWDSCIALSVLTVTHASHGAASRTPYLPVVAPDSAFADDRRVAHLGRTVGSSCGLGVDLQVLVGRRLERSCYRLA
jgi:hypothetical protein